MNNKKSKTRLPFLAAGLLTVILVFVVGCKKTDSGIDLAPFIEMAQNFPCTDICNRIFLIDGDKVLWLREGNCTDFRFQTILYGETLDIKLAETSDNIAGGYIVIYDESYRNMFETILANWHRKDLGLEIEHTVEIICYELSIYGDGT